MVQKTVAEIKQYILYLQKNHVMTKDTAKELIAGMDILYVDKDIIEMQYTELLALPLEEQKEMGIRLHYSRAYANMHPLEKPKVAKLVGVYICQHGTIEEKVKVINSNINYLRYVGVGNQEDLYLALAKSNGLNLRGMDRPSKVVREEALKQTPLAIHHILDPTEAEQLYAIEHSGEQLQTVVSGIRNITPTACNQAVKKDREVLAYLNDKRYMTNKQIIDLGEVTSVHELAYHPTYDLLTYGQWVGNLNEFEKVFGTQIPSKAVDKLKKQLGKAPTSEKKTQVAPKQVKGAYGKAETKKIMKRLMESGVNLEEIENPTEEMQIQAVTVTPVMIKKIQNPSDEVIKASLSRKGILLEYINNPTPEQRKIALRENGEAIHYIKDPTAEEQMIAIKQNPKNLVLIQKPTEEVFNYAIQQAPSVISEMNFNAKAQEEILHINPKAIIYMKNVTPELIDKAIDIDKEVVRVLKGKYALSEAQQLKVVKHNGYLIYCLHNPSEAVKKEAVRKTPSAIGNIENPSEELQLLAVTTNPASITFIKNPSETTQLVVIQAGKKYLKYIKNPTARVIEEANKQ